MAFEYLSGSSFNIINLVLVDILKISDKLLYDYTTPTDQIMYLVLIPSAILMLFVWTFGYWIVPDSGKGLRFLISAIAYIYMVYSGWYGSFIVSIILAWFPLVLLSFFAFFIMTKIFHPINIQGANAVIDSAFKKARPNKNIKIMEKQIDNLNHKISRLESLRRDMENKGNQRGASTAAMKITELEHQRMDLENKIKSML